MVYRATSTSQGLPGIINICSILETVHIVADEWVVWTHQLQTPDATETPYVKQPLWNCFMSLLFLVFGVNWTGPPMWYMFGQKKYLVHWGKWTHETTRLGLGNAQIINLFTTPHTTLESYSIHQDDIFCHHAEKLMHALFLRDILKICESHTFFIGDSFFFSWNDYTFRPDHFWAHHHPLSPEFWACSLIHFVRGEIPHWGGVQ